MFSVGLLALFSAAPALAAVLPASSKPAGCCDISKAKLVVPAGQTAIVASTLPTSFIALGVGIQNYTCSSAGTYASIGAVAQLFDLSCLYGKPAFDTIQNDVSTLWNKAPASLTAQQLISTLSAVKTSVVLGEHYFVTNPVTGTGISPKWDFTSKSFKGNANAFVVAAKSASLAAPTGSQDVDWLFLKSVTGDLAAEVYRTDTRLGQPPASCSPTDTSVLSVKYVSKYWLNGGSIKN